MTTQPTPVVDAGPSLDAFVVDAMVVDAQPPTPDMAVPDAAIEEPVLRFVALGDTGKANDGQHRVAEAMIDACQDFGGCNFALLLGDVIYDSGVENAQDAQWGPKI